MAAGDRDAAATAGIGQRIDHLQPGAVRHVQIDNDQIPLLLLDRRHGRRAVVRRRHFRHADLAQHPRQRGTLEFVLVDN